MQINLSPKVTSLYQQLCPKQENLERLLNALAFLYAKGELIKKEDIAGRVTIKRVIRKMSAEGSEIFDEASQSFKGVEVTGKLPSESIWIPSPELHDLLCDHKVVWVMKSPKKHGISIKEVNDIYIKIEKGDMA